jgi:hypothetical protein
MARRGRTSRAATVWRFPAAGFAAAAAVATFPSSPLGPGQWPVSGSFGAFTWTAWFIATGLSFTLLLLAAAIGLERRGRGAGRVALAALAFGLLALGTFAAAARADRIRQNPLLALAVTVAALVALRIVAARLAPGDSGSDIAE